MFTIFGLLLVIYGMVSDKSIYQKSLGLNVNLYWGAVMILFGLLMLVLGRRGSSSPGSTEADAPSDSPRRPAGH